MITKQMIELALRNLGVKSAANYDDPHRWSVSDLATDLADEFTKFDRMINIPKKSAQQFMDEEVAGIFGDGSPGEIEIKNIEELRKDVFYDNCKDDK